MWNKFLLLFSTNHQRAQCLCRSRHDVIITEWVMAPKESSLFSFFVVEAQYVSKWKSVPMNNFYNWKFHPPNYIFVHNTFSQVQSGMLLHLRSIKKLKQDLSLVWLFSFIFFFFLILGLLRRQVNQILN